MTIPEAAFEIEVLHVASCSCGWESQSYDKPSTAEAAGELHIEEAHGGE